MSLAKIVCNYTCFTINMLLQSLERLMIFQKFCVFEVVKCFNGYNVNIHSQIQIYKVRIHLDIIHH